MFYNLLTKGYSVVDYTITNYLVQDITINRMILRLNDKFQVELKGLEEISCKTISSEFTNTKSNSNFPNFVKYHLRVGLQSHR